MTAVISEGFSVVRSFLKRVLLSKEETILDPLSVAIRLALLCYKARKTKISIGRSNKHSIEYDEPDTQAIQRRAKGSTRNDIAALDIPIQIAVNLYNFNNPHIAYIFEKACDGLKELLCCYDHTHDTVCKAIQLYRNVLTTELAKCKQLKANSIASTTTSAITTTNIPSTNTTNINLIYRELNITEEKMLNSFDHVEAFKNVWTQRYVNIIYLLLTELESHTIQYNTRETSKDNVGPSLINSICELVDAKDKYLEQKVNEKHVQDILSQVREPNVNISATDAEQTIV